MMGFRGALALLLLSGCYITKDDADGRFDADGDGDDDITLGGDDCDDTDASIHSGAVEVPYDGVDQDCTDGDLIDQDVDGQASAEVGGDDCDDMDASAFPGAEEVPYDGVDQDCDGSDLVDQDADGSVSTEAGGDDCDDLDPEIKPGVTDAPCDDVDQNCDGFAYDAEDPPTVVEGGGDADEIQSAMDDSPDNGTVCVGPGTWLGQIEFDSRGIEVMGMGDKEEVILDGDGVGPVVTFGEGAEGAIRGLTVQGGTVPTTPPCDTGTYGGGIYANKANVQLSDLLVQGNKACTGGGAYIFGLTTAVTMEDVWFIGNDVGSAGGGFALQGGGTATLDRVYVLENRSDARAGGAFLYYSNPIMTDVVFEGNESVDDGGAIYGQGDGGAVQTITIEGGIFHDNHSTGGSGGAIMISSYYTLHAHNVDMRGNTGASAGAILAQQSCDVVLKNAIVAGNESDNTSYGGGAFTITGGSSISLENATIAGNQAQGNGGAVYLYDGSMTAVNASFYANTAEVEGGLVFLNDTIGESSFEASYSHAEGNVPEDVELDAGAGNITGDPEFESFDADATDPSVWDFHLKSSSLLLDAGDPELRDADGSPSDIGAYGGPDCGLE